jgi:hypothetical protein
MDHSRLRDRARATTAAGSLEHLGTPGDWGASGRWRARRAGATYRDGRKSIPAFRNVRQPLEDAGHGHLFSTTGSRASPDLHSAVYDDVNAGYVGTVVGGKKQRDLRDFVRPTETPKQRLTEHRARPFRILQLLARPVGLDHAR